MRYLVLLLSLSEAEGCGGGTAPVDRDCEDPDLDKDGYSASECGGSDCDDLSPDVHPGAWEGTDWIDELVDGERSDGGGISLALGPDGEPHVGRVEHPVAWANSTLRSAVRRSESWRIEDVASAPRGGTYLGNNGLEVTRDGATHLAYSLRDAAGDRRLYHAQDAGGAWVIDELSVGDPQEHNLLVDHAGAVHVVVADMEATLTHVSNATGSWISESVDSEALGFGLYAGVGLSAGIDSGDTVHVAYLALNDSGNPFGLRYATNASGAWRTEDVVFSASACLLALDIEGRPNILFVDDSADPGTFEGPQGPDTLRVAHLVDGEWEIEDIYASRGLIMLVSFAVDMRSAFHARFSANGLEGEPTFWNGEGSWSEDPLDPPGAIRMIFTADAVHVAYGRDATTRYATRSMPDGVDDDCDGVVW